MEHVSNTNINPYNKNLSSLKVTVGTRSRFAQKLLNDLFPHLIFYIIRCFFYSMLCIFLNLLTTEYKNKNKILFYREIANDIIFMMMGNNFQFYLMGKSIFSGNVYELYISIMLLAHNCVLSFLLSCVTYLSKADTHVGAQRNFVLVFILTSFLYLFEFIFTLKNVYKNKNDLNLGIFKKVGLCNTINKAFAARKFLIAFGPVLPFLAFSVVLKDSVGTFYKSWFSASLELLFLALVLVQKTLYAVKLNDENKTQRKITTGLAVINIPLALLLLFLTIYGGGFKFKYESEILYFDIILYADIIVVYLGFVYALMCDYRLFGSGLKDMNINLVPLNLN